jgi:hypothetical protein
MDTSPEAEAIQLEWFRTAPPWLKLRRMSQLNRTARSLAWSGLRMRHPHATPEELRRRWADLVLGKELAAQVYGPIENT